MKIALRLNNVSKHYFIKKEKPTLVERIFSANVKEQRWAVKDINIDIKAGEFIGVIGSNGSGKTTLLEIIGGIVKPTIGNMTVTGNVVSLIDLEAGFNSELTGRENIFLSGLLDGMSKKSIQDQFDSIVSFAGLTEFIDTPLFTYSLGMKMKLGFSIAIHNNPDILLIDEGISVGDLVFHQKIHQYLLSFRKNGKTLILVTHDMSYIENLCEKVFWLDNGAIIDQGQTSVLLERYKKKMHQIFLNQQLR